MLLRYDVTDTRDKFNALRSAREYSDSGSTVGENVTRFPVNLATQLATHPEKAGVSLGKVVAVQGFEPRTQRI
jgi:hypothetical protein